MEQASFTLLAWQHRDTIYRVALNCFGNPYDADDAVQEVLLKLYLEPKTFESPEHVRHWLIRVTLNHCRSVLRTPWRRKVVPLEVWADDLAFETGQQSELFQSVMALKRKYRTVLYLYYYEEYSVREIAELLQTRVSTVTTRLSRAREQLKQILSEV